MVSRNNLKELTKNNPKSNKNIIANLIQNKIDFLNPKTNEINPLHIRLIKVVSTFEKENKNRRFCLLTGLNISMQKRDSFLLSHTGLKYYYKTDKGLEVDFLLRSEGMVELIQVSVTLENEETYKRELRVFAEARKELKEEVTCKIITLDESSIIFVFRI